MDTIGKRMRLARINKQKTLEDIAKAVGVSRQTIQRYESGVIGNIPYDKIEGIATSVLGLVGDTSYIDPDELLTFKCVEKILKVQEPYKKAAG